MRLSWQDLQNETSYTLYRNTTGMTSSGDAIGGVGVNITMYTDAAFVPNQTNYYWVRAFNATDTSEFSEQIFIVMMTPIQPAGVTATWLATNVFIRWQDLVNETSYTLFRSTSSSTGTAAVIGGTGMNETNFTDTGFAINSTNYYWVKAYNEFGKSGFSAVAPVFVPWYRVFNRTQGLTYWAITNALKGAVAHDLIEATNYIYNEYVNMANLSSVTLRAIAWRESQDKTSTIIDGTGHVNCLRLERVTNSRIEGFFMKNANVHGVYLAANAINNIIINCIVCSNGNNDDGININSGSADYNSIISNDIFANDRYGVRVKNGDYNKVVNNVLVNNNRGVELDDGANFNYIANNYIAHNSSHGIRFDSDTDNNTVTNNIICSNASHGINVNLDSSDGQTIVRNTIFSNQGSGVRVSQSDNNIISFSNIIYKNLNAGILIQNNADNNEVSGNIIYSNQGAGIRLLDPGAGGLMNNIRLRGNLITGNSAGIDLTGLKLSTYISNNILENNSTGISFTNSAEQSVRREIRIPCDA
ncbi:hypothetical protein ES703_113448 [subsurface metagenome]